MRKIKDIFSSRLTINSKRNDYKVLFEELYNRLVYFSFQITNSSYDSEDIVQESFIQLWNNIDSLATHKDVYKQYLYKSVKNLSLNYIRHQRVKDRYNSYLHAHYNEAEDSILEHIIYAEVIAQLNEIIEELPMHLKQLSDLSFYEGKKNQEVADELGISVNTLKKQKQKILHLLKTKFSSLLCLFFFL